MIKIQNPSPAQAYSQTQQVMSRSLTTAEPQVVYHHPAHHSVVIPNAPPGQARIISGKQHPQMFHAPPRQSHHMVHQVVGQSQVVGQPSGYPVQAMPHHPSI